MQGLNHTAFELVPMIVRDRIYNRAMALTILGIAGSLRKGSLNRALLRAAVELAPGGAVIETFDLAPIPLYNGDEEHDLPAPVRDLKLRIRAADAILFST